MAGLDLAAVLPAAPSPAQAALGGATGDDHAQLTAAVIGAEAPELPGAVPEVVAAVPASWPAAVAGISAAAAVAASGPTAVVDADDSVSSSDEELDAGLWPWPAAAASRRSRASSVAPRISGWSMAATNGEDLHLVAWDVRRAAQELKGSLPRLMVGSWRLLGQSALCLLGVLALSCLLTGAALLLVALLASLPWTDAAGTLNPRVYLGGFAVIVLVTTLMIGVFMFAAFRNFEPGSLIAVLRLHYLDLLLVACSCALAYGAVIWGAGPAWAARQRVQHWFAVLFAGGATWVTNLRTAINHSSSPHFKARLSRKRASALRRGRPPPRVRPPWLQALRTSAPAAVVLLGSCVYVFGIKPLHTAIDTSSWRIAVYCFSVFIVKTGGEKMLVTLFCHSGATGGVDAILFTYEMVMSLQARLLLLGEPDPVALVVASVLSGLWEFLVRLFFTLLVLRSMKRAQDMLSDLGLAEPTAVPGDLEEAEQRLQVCEKALAAAELQKLVYAQNLGGDMLVEYVGANVAMILTLMLGQEEVFAFGTAGMTWSLVVTALLAQHLPEVVCDLCAIYFELAADLDVQAYLQKQLNWRVLASKTAAIWQSIVWAVAARLI